MSYIYIVPIELDDHTYLEKMERFIFETFHKETKIEEMRIDLAAAFAGTDDKIVSKAANFPHIQQDDIARLLLTGGFYRLMC